MITTLLLAALIGQAPSPLPAKARSSKPTAGKAALAKAATSTNPAAEASNGAAVTLRKRKEAAAKKKQRRANQAALERYHAEQWRLYVERVGPVIAAQQREAWQRQMQTRQAAAMEALGQAALAEAVTDRARLRLEQQQAGMPMIAIPGQGLVPYAGGYAGPQP